MKKASYILLLFLATLSACKKNTEPDIQPVNLKLKVSYGLEASNYVLPLKGVNIKLKNKSTGKLSELQTNADGDITFNSITAGSYDISASITIAAAEYTKITGLFADKDITFNASANNKQVISGQTDPILLKLVAGTIGDWVIKQVYYAGSDRVEGALYRDQFVEFYNNSDHVLYADSLYFGQVWGKQTNSVNKYYETTNGQMDWSKSQGANIGNNANSDYVYLRTLLMIPGTGKTYPVQPGESIVLAQTAVNHKTPFIGADGTSISVRNPALTVDLSKADFEAYYGDILMQQGKKPLDSDIDNPAVPNVQVLSYFGNDMIIDNPGRDSYVIFKADKSQDVKNWPQYYEPTIATPTSTAKKYYQVPNKYILDAVEIMQTTLPKKLGASLDAGFTNAPKGSYTSQSVIRKTESIVNGRRILKDTNNSTEDFTFLDMATPRGFK